MIVLAYPRVSTDEQAEKGNSLFEQQERITAYCKAMGWDDPIFFIDDGYSAKNLNRPELTKLLGRVKEEPSGGIVITTKLDRLSRKLFDILSLNEYFNKHNFNYVSATEGFDTSTPAGRLVLQMLGMVAEFERERNSERVRDNMLSLAKNSDKIITRPCFGYDVVDGQMMVNIEESLLIKHAASDLLSGKSSRNIKRLWNASDIKTKEGNDWHDKTFRELFQRETLIGNFVYNKTKREGTKVIQKDESEWIRIENHHEPILDKDTFQKLQELFQGRKSVGKHMSDDTYLLSGLVYCGHCKSKMNGKKNKNFSKKLNQENIHYQYLCDGYLKKSKCYHHYVKRDDIEALIIERIRELSKSAPGTLKLVVSKPTQNHLDKELIMSKLARLDKKMQKHIDAFDDDLITAHDLKNATKRVNEERESLRRMLEESESETIKKQEVVVHNKAKSLIDNILSSDRIRSKQSIRQLIEKIVLMYQ
ncbi:recombinase family protein [Paenibacillus sp.]|jgi:site-specific DNA recombinase|uniref:recombinase family protein n=1 Tax=Paenibacillus sp. TaxID=58172 RepID=UPI002831354C|nr:recombinase family protein [Paenibacillus sp.]MDR0269316.1 recombinase family protein [Paenibacillus sp.]